MIKVIASDLDGTLLNEDHQISQRTLRAIRDAQENGICFIAATGRGYEEAKIVLEPAGLRCKQILASGSEVRDETGTVVRSIAMGEKEVEQILEIASRDRVAAYLFTKDGGYIVGNDEEVEDYLVAQLQAFFLKGTREEIMANPLYEEVKKASNVIKDRRTVKEKALTVFKIFLFSQDFSVIHKIKKEMEVMPGVASAASSEDNVELTDVNAQKGPVLKWYIEQLGYRMDEVMVLGDSLNDFSMLSMDFGVCVGMENAVQEIKEIVPYLAPSNEKDGAAYAIEKLLAGKLEDLRKQPENPQAIS